MMVEDAIGQTAAMAKDLLFDKGGKPKGHDHFLALLTLSTILRPATAAEQAQPGWGQKLFDWDGRPYLYDSGIALAWIEDAEKGDSTADRVLCGAAAVLLTKTATISDPNGCTFTVGLPYDRRKRELAVAISTEPPRQSVPTSKGRFAAPGCEAAPPNPRS